METVLGSLLLLLLLSLTVTSDVSKFPSNKSPIHTLHHAVTDSVPYVYRVLVSIKSGMLDLGRTTTSDQLADL